MGRITSEALMHFPETLKGHNTSWQTLKSEARYDSVPSYSVIQRMLYYYYYYFKIIFSAFQSIFLFNARIICTYNIFDIIVPSLRRVSI